MLIVTRAMAAGVAVMIGTPLLALAGEHEGAWSAAESPLMTPWAAEVSSNHVHPEYPRPQLVREKWLNLNGLWQYAIRPRREDQPREFDGSILVPFPVESALSGVKRSVGEGHFLWYRRTCEIPDTWRSGRVLLHFGAADWEATVWVNGSEVGSHRGGYDPFSFDITPALREGSAQELLVRVWDPTDKGYQPRGKQVEKPHSIWYTSVSGIWQTVWVEPVPATFVRGLKLTPDVDSKRVLIELDVAGPVDGLSFMATARDEDSVSARTVSESPHLTLRLNQPRLWTPESPFLYDLEVAMLRAGEQVDSARSYFGMRKIEVRQDTGGINRLFLNNEPLFQFGPLDQGWWPDGLYTAPTDDALRFDIETTKKLGFNMCRKHVKVEPQRWYYWCDTLGLLVWQDMPNGDRHISGDDPDVERSPESAETFRREYQAMIDARRNHPCIVAWVPFNEGWGQFATNEIIEWTKQYDPTRLVDGPSGWTDRGKGDMYDIHRYPGPDMPPLDSRRAAVLGEFGGLGWPVPGHLWQDKDNWGYRTYDSREALVAAYRDLLDKLAPLVQQGLAAAVYTQTTDVEVEVNGLMTYDRKVIKLPFELSRENARLRGASR